VTSCTIPAFCRIQFSIHQAHRLILIETKYGAGPGKASCWENLEHLNAFVIAAGHQQIFTIIGDHEIAWMTTCGRVVHLLKCSVREYMEGGNAVILETM
jgi:hypothetical protein